MMLVYSVSVFCKYPHSFLKSVPELGKCYSSVITLFVIEKNSLCLLLTMKTTFILCKSPDTQRVTHVICTTHPVIFNYSRFNLISGSDDPKVRENTNVWFENRDNPKYNKVRSQPPGFQKALAKVKQFKDQVNIAELAEAVGISEKLVTLFLEDEKWMGATVRIPMTHWGRCIMAVSEFVMN